MRNIQVASKPNFRCDTAPHHLGDFPAERLVFIPRDSALARWTYGPVTARPSVCHKSELVASSEVLITICRNQRQLNGSQARFRHTGFPRLIIHC